MKENHGKNNMLERKTFFFERNGMLQGVFMIMLFILTGINSSHALLEGVFCGIHALVKGVSFLRCRNIARRPWKIGK